MPSSGRFVVLAFALSAIVTSVFLSEFLVKIYIKRWFNRPEPERDGEGEFGEFLDGDVPVCTADLVSASSYDELRTPLNTKNVAKAVDTVKTHGVTFVEGLLSKEQASKLRAYIMRENKRSGRSKEFVTEMANREHLTFGLDEDPIIREAVHSIVTSQPLRAVLEELLGPDAALMELASITAFPGANGQFFHEDTHIADDVVDIYSLFIPLQKTTREMGATALCPGTHTCSGFEDDYDEQCDGWDKTLYAEVEAGTGVLMNSKLYHKGSANTSPDTNDGDDDHVRVMFYTSWAEPPSRGDGYRRVPPGGGTYAIRKDQLGRSLSQIANGTYSILSSIDFWSQNRGWNIFELGAAKLSSNSDVFGVDLDAVESCAERLWSVGVGLLILYVAIAEIDLFLHRRRSKQQEQQHEKKHKVE